MSKVDLDNEEISAAQSRVNYSIQTLKKRDVTNRPFGWARKFDVIPQSTSSQSSGSSAILDPIEFDVFEREGFNQIMETVGQSTRNEHDKFARCLRDTLEVVGALTPGWYVAFILLI